MENTIENEEELRKIAPEIAPAAPRTLLGDAWRKFRRHKLAMLGVTILGLIVLFVLIGPLFYTVDPRKIDFMNSMTTPSLEKPFGCDDMGHDLFARAMFGGRISLEVGLLAMLVSVTLGVLIGAISGFFGGAVDMLLMRFTDMCIALPRLPVLLVIIYLFRDSIRKILGAETGILVLVVGVIGALGWMQTARIVRASFLSAKEKEYVEAAICCGTKKGAIMFRHILPNVLSPVIVSASIGVGSAILTESSLSFLGLGFPPDVPTWGRMLYDAQNYTTMAPHMAIVPGVLIFLTILSINFIGDGLRDALDPQQRAM